MNWIFYDRILFRRVWDVLVYGRGLLGGVAEGFEAVLSQSEALRSLPQKLIRVFFFRLRIAIALVRTRAPEGEVQNSGENGEIFLGQGENKTRSSAGGCVCNQSMTIESGRGRRG